MNKILKGLFAFSLLVSAVPVSAGLGDAEGGTTNRTFDAYCGKKGNNCKVMFANDKLTVNQKDSISKGQILKYTVNPNFYCESGMFGEKCDGEGSVLVIYQEEGREGSGIFIFVHKKTFMEFVNAITAFCGAGCRPIGPSIKLEQ